MFCLLNNEEYEIKILPLHSLNPCRKLQWAEVGQTYIMVKGVFVRFCFDSP